MIRPAPRWVRETIRTVKVASCADGTLRVQPEYRDEPIEPGATPVGVLTRLALARWCERELNAALRRRVRREGGS